MDYPLIYVLGLLLLGVWCAMQAVRAHRTGEVVVDDEPETYRWVSRSERPGSYWALVVVAWVLSVVFIVTAIGLLIYLWNNGWKMDG